ncbi:MAG: prenyltransferase/squalene oxidase repeat-containing protein [Candidatus Helarchaeota archaeon]
MDKILPFWEYTKRIYPFTKDIMEIQAEIIHAYQLNQIQTVQDAFWSIFALDSVKKLDMIDVERIEKFILENLKGYKFYNQKYKKDDLKTLFCALGALKILGRLDEYSEKTIDGFANSVLSYDTNSGFVHCYDSSCPECDGKSKFEYIFYGIASLILLNKLNKLDEEKYTKIFSIKLGKKSHDLVYYLLGLVLLNRIDQIDESYFSQILNFESESGGFNFSGALPTIADTFWVVSLYSGLGWLRRSRNLGKVLEFIRSIYSKKEEKVPFYEMDLRDYCYATLIISFIYDDLTENIAINLLNELYEKDLIFYEELMETYYVKKDIIELVINELKSKSWFHASIINNKDNYREFLRGLNRPRQILAEEIVKRIRENNRLDLTEYSSTIKSPAVIEITKAMMNKKIIIGEIKTIGRFLRKEHYIFHGYMPEKGVKWSGTRDSNPCFKIIEERERFPYDEKEVNKILEKMEIMPETIFNKIYNLIDCDKVNIAKIQLKEEYNEALNFLNKSNNAIQKRLSKYKYLNKKYLKSLEDRWSKTLEKTRIQLNNIKNDLVSRIEKKEITIKALNDLEEFQEFVEKNLRKIKYAVENVTKLFQNSVSEFKLEKNKDKILEEVNKIINEIEQLTPNLETQVELLNKIVEKAKLMENMEVGGIKFEPLHMWLEREFLNKRSYTLKTLSEIKSKLYKREELKRIIQDKKDEFDKLIHEIEELINKNISAKNYEAANNILKNKTKETLRFMESINHYIIDFIKDTTNLIDGFDLVVDDIMDYWLNEVIVQMQNQVINLKIDLEKKIISQKELDRRNKLDTLVENNIKEIKNIIEEFKSSIEELLEKESNIDFIVKELENKFSQAKKMLITCDQQINKFLKSSVSEFPSFYDTANVQIFKWNSFKKNFKDKISFIHDNLLNKCIVKYITITQKLYRNGRVKIETIKDVVNQKVSEIRKRIRDLIASGAVDGEYYPDKDEVIIFTPERKKIIDFEDKINKFMVKLNNDNKNIQTFFVKSCKKRQIESTTNEIFTEIKEIFNKSNNYDEIIKKEIQTLQKDALDVKIVLKQWENFKNNLQDTLLSINKDLKKRLDLKELITDSISIFKTKIKELPDPIEKLINNKELEKAKQLLDTRVLNLIQTIKDFDISIHDILQKEEKKYFKTLVSDLIDNWKDEQKLLFEQIFLVKGQIIDKIKQIQLTEKKKELEKLIENKIKELNNIIEEMGEIVYPQISIDLKLAQKKLLSISNVFHSTIKETLKEINSYVKDVSNNISVEFKRMSEILVDDFKKNINSLTDLFDQTYQMLEDEMILKNLEDLKTAFGTKSVDIGIISNTLKVPKNHIRDRIIQLIASGKLQGIMDPEAFEYKFSEYLTEEDLKPHILLEDESFFKKLLKIIKKWQSIVAFLAPTITIGVALMSLTNNILPVILIPLISILAAIIFVYIKHNREKKKKIP